MTDSGTQAFETEVPAAEAVQSVGQEETTMSEEPTEKLNDRSWFEARVLSELATLGNRLTTLDNRLTTLDNRLTTLEEKVDARLRETRPIWESVLSKLDVMNSKLDVLALDLLETRAQTDLLKKRLPPAA